MMSHAFDLVFSMNARPNRKFFFVIMAIMYVISDIIVL